MKILIISGSFYPIIAPRSFRTTELVKELSRKGNNVTLYIPKDGIDRDDLEKEYGFSIQYYERPKDKLINSKSKLVYFIERCMVHGFAYPDISILRTLKSSLKNEKNDYDLLITIAAPHAIHWTIGKMYKSGRRLAKTWVADCGDPYMLGGTLSVQHPFYFKYIEKLWCRECNYIAVPTEGAINGYYPEFKDKIRVISQAFNFEEIERVQYVKNEVPTFVYSGSIWNGSKDPKPFLDFLTQIPQDFRFYVYTKDVHVLDSYKEIFKEKLIVSPFIPRLELIKKLSSMDFLVHFEFHTSVQTPSKLIDYSLSGRPILAVNVKRIETDKDMIMQFLSGDYSKQYIVKDMSRYDIHNVAQQFMDLTK